MDLGCVSYGGAPGHPGSCPHILRCEWAESQASHELAAERPTPVWSGQRIREYASPTQRWDLKVGRETIRGVGLTLTWIQIAAPPVTSSVTLSSLLTFLSLSFLICKIEIIASISHGACKDIKWGNARTESAQEYHPLYFSTYFY